jgi:MFS family permease
MLESMSISRSFHILLGANAASNLADGLAFVSIPLLAASLTDDPRLIAGLATVYALVRLLVALPIGVWVDRTDRHILLALANLVRGAVILALAICLLSGVEGLVLLYVAFGILGTLESAADNAAVSLVPSYVQDRDLDRANGRISATQLVSDEFFGPPLGGLLFTVAATAPVFMLGGFWAVAGFLALALPRTLKRPVTDPELSAPRAFWAEAVDGLRWIAQNRVVGALALIGALASIGYMLPFSILVLFAQDRLGVNETQYGLILAVSALGGLAGSFLTSRVRAQYGYRMTIAASLLTGAISLFALAITTEPTLAAILLAIYILHAVVWGICATSLRQRLVPEDLRGRVNAASRVLGLLGLAIGSIAGGTLATIDLSLTVTAGGAVFTACTVLALILIQTDDGQPPAAA